LPVVDLDVKLRLWKERMLVLFDRLKSGFVAALLQSFLILGNAVAADGVETFRLPASREIAEASVFVVRPEVVPRGVLVLCPGQNGSSETMLGEQVWRSFVRRNNLALAGFRFISSDEDLKNGRGYFVAARGSGALLEKGLLDARLGDMPIYLYGFSGGAHFTMSFAAWRPERVKGFCAYSFSWWTSPPSELACPALIVCGQNDGTRYGASQAYFQSGRAQGKPWTWLSLEGLGHQPSGELDEFVREYFSAILIRRARNGDADGESVSANNMTEKLLDKTQARNVGVSVLPSLGVFPAWKELHHP